MLHNVVVCILLEIYNSDVLHVESILHFLKTLNKIKCCVRFFVPRNGDSFICVKQWKGILFACMKQW